MEIIPIQTALKEAHLDAWLLADFHSRNNVAVETLGLSGIVTRRSFYLIPSEGTPTALVAPIERSKFQHLPGEIRTFHGYKSLELELASLLRGKKRIAMEYSPWGRLPYIGLVDAGTIELVRSFGLEVVSSADLVANFQARLSGPQITCHHKAAEHLLGLTKEAHGLISRSLEGSARLTEYDVVQFLLQRFDALGMETQYPPNCSVDANAGDPHYEPQPDTARTIERGQLVLIDHWARLREPAGVYADITWMAFAGKKEEIPLRYVELFDCVARARDAAIAYLRENFGKRPLYGCDVDDVCRQVIVDAGYGQYFTHRTGHSITAFEHGSGPNIDNLETEDKRLLQPGHLFSIEPGVYFEDCGFRTEVNVLITPEGPEVTTLPLQTEIVALL